MPTFEITAPDGAKYRVTAPEGATEQDALAHVQQSLAQQPAQPSAQQPGVLEDIAKTVPSAAGRLVANTLGQPGDIGSLQNAITQKITGAVPIPAAQAPMGSSGIVEPGLEAIAPAPRAMLPSSETIKHLIEKVTGPLYQPQTTAGGIVDKAIQLAPAGVGGAANLPTRLATQVGLPAVAGQAAQEAGGGPVTQAGAEIASAILGHRLTAPRGPLINPERGAAVQTLQNEGVNALTAGQITGSRPIQYMEQAFGDIPGAGRQVANRAEQQAEQFTAAALRRAGENANRATPEVIDNAFNRIGNQFETIAARNAVTIDPRLARDLRQVEQNYNNITGPSQRAPIVANTIQDIAQLAGQQNGILPGASYGNLRSTLGRLARQTNDPSLERALYGLQRSLDDAMNRSLAAAGNHADIAALAEARRQYRNLLVIRQAATGPGSETALGLISPSQLRTATKSQSVENYARGRGDFADLARAGEAVMKTLPQSGTAPRSYAQHLPAVAMATLAGLFGGAPAAGLAGLGTLVGPPLAGRALLSGPVQAMLARRAYAAPGGNLRAGVPTGLLAAQQSGGLLSNLGLLP